MHFDLEEEGIGCFPLGLCVGVCNLQCILRFYNLFRKTPAGMPCKGGVLVIHFRISKMKFNGFSGKLHVGIDSMKSIN